MYQLWLMENNKYGLYGGGDMSYIMELLEDYLNTYKMYEKESMEFKVCLKIEG